MEINLDLLKIQNPWWEKDEIGFDPLLVKPLKEPFEIWRKFINGLDVKKNKIYTLHGTRGVGKSTISKIIIKDLIKKKKVNPKNIFYYSCHNIDTYEQLNELIKIYLSWRSTEKKQVFIFIDEITLIKNWTKGINYFINAGKLKNASVFLIGSTLLSGDRGRVKFEKDNIKFDNNTENKILSTLDFKEFIKLINPEIYEGLEKNNFLLPFKKLKTRINQEKNKIKKLDYYLDIYFLTGGFISSVSDFINNGSVSQKIYTDYLSWLIGDMAKLGRNVILMRQIIEQVILNLGNTVGYKTIAKKTDAKTHLTVEDYLKILEATLSLKLVYQSDETGKAYLNRAKKVYFRDPFLFWIFYSYVYGSLNYWEFSRSCLHKKEIFNSLVENVVFSHLIKEEKIENWEKKVSFLKDNKTKEDINFLFHQESERLFKKTKKKKKTIPILIRYGRKISQADYNLIERAGFKKGIIITEKEIDLNSDIKSIPLILFLLNYKKILSFKNVF
jgi:hypothetical protein